MGKRGFPCGAAKLVLGQGLSPLKAMGKGFVGKALPIGMWLGI